MSSLLHSSARKLIKICGNRFPEDAWRVAACQPDFMGWIFSPRSPRRIPPELAVRLIAMIRRSYPDIRHVGVLAGNTAPEIWNLVRSGPRLDFLQIVDGPGFVAALEGSRSRISHCRNSYSHEIRQKYCRNSYTGRIHPVLPPVLPVIRVRERLTDTDLTARYGNRPFWFMDSYVPGQPGGTGRRFAPELVADLRRPFMLAGGLNDENVREALLTAGALGADVSSGIELPDRPGRKDPTRLVRFVAAVRSISDET